ncbi:MAG: polysaccharide deacetylase family protein [Clostridia bacterium]|nr:polysaccharide deacetylase family protein [Clostridia bacterium]
MKKIYQSAIALLLAASMCGCTANGNTQTEETPLCTLPQDTTSVEETVSTETTSSETSQTTTSFQTTTSVHTTQTTTGQTTVIPSDPKNARKEFSYGAAKNGKPHQISVDNQAYFDSLKNVSALALDTKTEEKVIYLTFSCGYEYNGNTKKIVDILNEKNVDAAFFCALKFYQKNPDLIREMIEEGHILGNHTMDYPDVSKATAAELTAAIGTLDRYLADTYGYDCKYFSFPSGTYTENALSLVSGLGHHIVFWSLSYADWDTENPIGYEKALKTVTERLHPGAVVMLHPVSADNVAILGDFIDYARQNGYTFKTLDDYFNENSQKPSENEGKTEIPTVSAGYTVYDPENLRGLSEEKVPYSFGVGTNGKPPKASLDNQARFDSMNNVSALAVDTKTEEKVLYLTFDCGYEYKTNTSLILDILEEKDVDAAFFCTLSFLEKNKSTSRKMIEDGHIVGNHSATHPVFPDISRTEMAKELYDVDQYLRQNFGYDCNYFRFPTGAYSESALELATSVGHHSVFWSVAYADWDTENQKSYDEAFETVTSRLHSGAVILLHAVSDTNVEILADFIDYARAEGYTFKTLDDYFVK